MRVKVTAFSFLITNQLGRCVLFDMGLREDWSKLPPAVTKFHNDAGIYREPDACDILKAHGLPADKIEAIILKLFTPVSPFLLQFSVSGTQS